MTDVAVTFSSEPTRITIGKIWRRTIAVADAALTWMTGLGEFASASRAVENFQILARMSDAELSERGLSREELVEHCFGHLFPYRAGD